AFTQGVQAQMVPPRASKSFISPCSGSSGWTWVVSAARLRTRSTPALVRKIETLRPAVMPPLAMVKATDESSWSIPWVTTTTRLRADSGMTDLLGDELFRYSTD